MTMTTTQTCASDVRRALTLAADAELNRKLRARALAARPQLRPQSGAELRRSFGARARVG